MPKRRIVDMDIDELPDAPTNAKGHAQPVITASVDRFGVIEPNVLDERTGRLISGHGRRDAYRQMRADGADPPEGVTVKGGRWFVPVVRGWSSANDEEAEAAAVALNRAGEVGGWKEPDLAAILARVAKTPPALTGLGYDARHLAALNRRYAPEPAKDADDAPPAPAADETITRPGDVWILGRHRLMCGDCTKPENVATLFGDATPELTLTDPPYCSGGFQETGKSMGSVGTSATHKQIANDRLSTRGYIALLKSALGNAPSAFAYVFTDWRMWTYLFDVVESSGFGVRSMIVWDKNTPGMGRGWRAQHELIMWAAKSVPPFDKHMSGVGNVVSAQRTGNLLHTTQKPVDLLERLLEVADFAPDIYDPFAGAGSTLMAAEAKGRRWFGMELDAAYCDVTARRWENFGGTPAVRAATGETVRFSSDNA